MRSHHLVPCLLAAWLVGACGDKTPKSSDANAAEVSTVPAETPEAPPSTPIVAGPVSFDDATAAFNEKRYEEAVRMLITYTAGQPENVWGYYLLGLSAWKAGDPERAVDAFTLALEKDSTHVKSHLNLGRVLIEQGKAGEALPHVDAVLKLDSTSSTGFRLLGRVRDELDDSEGAIEAFKHAIVLDGRDAWSFNNIGSIYITQGRFEEALGPIAQAIEIDSMVSTFYNNLGIALEQTGRVIQAADAYRLALEVDGTYQKAAANLVRVEKAKQDPSVALVDLRALAQGFAEQATGWR